MATTRFLMCGLAAVTLLGACSAPAPPKTPPTKSIDASADIAELADLAKAEVAVQPSNDADGDGWCAGDASGCAKGNGDCNDQDPNVHPAAVEVCNGVDDDCNGSTDDGIGTVWYDDADGDGWGGAGPGVLSFTVCAALAGHAWQTADCDDANPLAHPGAPEVCNGFDDNCDGKTDPGCVENLDADADGVCSAKALCFPGAGGCPGGCGDCDDGDAMVFPAMLEACDGLDSNCNGWTDEGCPATCGDGVCAANESIACASDCASYWPRFGGSCSAALSWQGCPHGYVCVPRGSGAVCVADFDTWAMLPDAISTTTAFQLHEGYFIDIRTRLWWAVKPPVPGPSGQLAVECAQLDLGAKQDWHMPTVAEVLSLSGLRQEASVDLWPVASAKVPLGKTAAPGKPAGAMWFASFWDGDSGVSYLDTMLPGWSTVCVRSEPTADAPPLPSARFVLEDGGLTVLDLRTGLHWQATVIPLKQNWGDALIWCPTNQLQVPGNGWRMPSGHELLTLVDRQAAPPTIDPIFAGTPAAPFWTTAVNKATPQSAFVVDFAGATERAAVSTTQFVRCVR